MKGLMQDQPLLVSSLIEHAEAFHGDTEIVSVAPEGTVRTSYAQVGRRSRQLARALLAFGVGLGDRVATLAFNTHRHLELYYGVSGLGAICHTVNPRLFLEQIVYIVGHAEDRILFFDPSQFATAETIAAQCPSVTLFVALCDAANLPTSTTIDRLQAYETFIAAPAPGFAWPEFDERTASSLCYTSGTTGHPKGVLYTHRSTVLHTLAAAAPDNLDIGARDVVLTGSSMYHANAWGTPYVATMTGAKLVLPGARLDGESLCDLVEAEGVTISFGVPTIWSGFVQYLQASGRRTTSLRKLVIGGAACPLALMDRLRETAGIEVAQLWGMTETSPLGTINKPKGSQAATGQRAKQGRVVYGVRMRIVDDRGRELPRDGRASGELMVKGPWVASGYYQADGAALDADGWFATGDIATLDADGFMAITDRSKDIIKTGGEWISSIDLENAASAHPDVVEAAVVGIAHPRWDERPLMVVVARAGAEVTRQAMVDFLTGKVAKWWLPDDVVCVDALPHTATGKVRKLVLRERWAIFSVGTCEAAAALASQSQTPQIEPGLIRGAARPKTRASS